MIGVEYKNVSRMIKETADPKLSTLQWWAELLQVKIASLYRDD